MAMSLRAHDNSTDKNSAGGSSALTLFRLHGFRRVALVQTISGIPRQHFSLWPSVHARPPTSARRIASKEPSRSPVFSAFVARSPYSHIIVIAKVPRALSPSRFICFFFFSASFCTPSAFVHSPTGAAETNVPTF